MHVEALGFRKCRRIVWDRQVFVGVLESLNITYVLFTPVGVPLRAKLSVARSRVT